VRVDPEATLDERRLQNYRGLWYLDGVQGRQAIELFQSPARSPRGRVTVFLGHGGSRHFAVNERPEKAAQAGATCTPFP
jgi:hypothetical protein